MTYLESFGIFIVSSQFGKLAHGIDTHDSLEGKIGLQS